MISFHQLHITYLNFTEVVRRSHICAGRSITAYLQVKFEGAFDEEEEDVPVKNRKLNRADTLRAIHESIKFALSNLVDVAVKGF